MLRNRNLIPLSHQHRRALLVCVRIDRASPIADADLAAWQAEIAQLFQAEIKIHFTAEEDVLFPAARQFPALAPLVGELLLDHLMLREDFAVAEANAMSAAEVSAFGGHLSTHIRKEERQLFEGLQEVMSREELERLGRDLEEALKGATESCIVPSEATRLRAAK
jgi:hemerythrin-like domain-containing protein